MQAGEISQATIMPCQRQDTVVSGGQYAQVLVNLEAKDLDRRAFTYRVPDEFREVVRIGTPVAVPFGQIPQVSGFVVGFAENPPQENIRLKEIADILDETPLFTAEYLSFLDWVGQRYATPLTQVIATALPGSLIQTPRKEVRLGAVLPEGTDPALTPPGRKLLAFLQGNGKPYTPKYLSSRLKIPVGQLNKLLTRFKTRQWVSVETSLSQNAGPKTEKHVVYLSGQAKTPRQQEVLDYLKQVVSERPRGSLPLTQLLSETGVSRPVVTALEKAGHIRIEELPLIRDPLTWYKTKGSEARHDLSVEQQRAVEAILADGTARETPGSGKPWLLFGVTGSGKTEVYLALTEKMLEAGRSVLVMLPEIALTSQIAKRFMARFGAENIAIWHSNLSAGERSDTWRRMATGELKIVIGARSAIFAPLQHLGLIVIDEEHDGSFKQDSPAPRYNAKVLAAERASRSSALLVMGSATPDVQTHYEAVRDGRLLVLPERFGGRQLATVETVDMKKEKASGNPGILSRHLLEALGSVLEASKAEALAEGASIEAPLQARQQAIILINRRGFYTLIQCSECEHVFKCSQCDVALTFHRSRNQVRCHYCGYEAGVPQYCPHCASMEIIQTGIGSQRVEEEIHKKFPEARLLRLDSDVMQQKNAAREIYEAFKNGEADILVGTQMVAKGLDIPNVTLVGVVSADSSFYLPDFKSSERGFQLLTQVAGRAGRGDKPGRVILQSYDPGHAVIQFARSQDYPGFYAYELLNREGMGFPPFSQLFRFIVSSPDDSQARHFSQALAANFRVFSEKHGLSEQIQALGPAVCVIPRIQGRYRYHYLLKNFSGERGHELITRFYQDIKPPEGLRCLLDPDAQSLL